LKNLGLGEAAKRDVGTEANQLPDMNSFGRSLANNGYQKLPGGLIIQWGYTATGPTGNTVTLPVAFNSWIAGCAGNEAGDDTSIKVVAIIPKSLSTLKISGRIVGGNTLANTVVRWIAIGY
ncbi:gp53-like domain-containing protein, partial [Mixta theicola]|uniref:gp53-like domain-containing protein n=1 Tax=Mixta theicola TaxID=1458355 RepID=UPI003908A703